MSDKSPNENRISGETLTQTQQRLLQEGKLTSGSSKTQDEQIEEQITFDNDLSIPRYKIIQQNCRIQGAVAGNWRNMLTEEEVPKLENVVFLLQQNTRSLFEQNDFSGVKLCWSYNGYVPTRDEILAKTGKEPPSTVCAARENGKLVYNCSYAAWRNELGEADDNGKKQPLCKGSITFLGLDSLLMPFWMVFHGAALPIVKNFLRYIKYRKEQAKRCGSELRFFDFRVTLGLEMQTTAKGQFYLPVFENKQQITGQAEKEVLQRAYETLKDRFLSEPLQNGD